MQISDEQIQELKTIMREDYGREASPEEVYEVGQQLICLEQFCVDGYIEEKRRKRKLEENPRGFTLEGVGYSCSICGDSTDKDENWYDKWGIKCLICQDSINRKEIPASLAKNQESWYSKYDLESAFKLKGKVLNSWVREGILKPRVITSRGGGTHYTLFLIKDNKGMLPPKYMVEDCTVKEKGEDGKEYHATHPWYHFVDPWKHLKDYKIMDYMKVPEETDKSKEFFNSLNLSLTENHFDSRDPIVKRKEFNSKRNQLLKQLLEERGSKCQLKLFKQCEGKLVLDHMIPLSSNTLNKDIYKLKAEKGKKILSQSFGSNYPENLLIACEKCNNHKKHRFVRKNKRGNFELN